MDKKRPGIDIINMLLEDCILAYPVSSFIISLYKQYLERGFLSKKQLQGLYDKASQIKDMPPGKLAALEAMIKKMPTRYKSGLPTAKPLYQKDESAGQVIDQILVKYPQHKRALYLKSKYDNNEPLTAIEIADLKRLKQLLK